MNQPLSSFRLNLLMVTGTMFLHGFIMFANEVFFRKAEFLQGIGWIYIPAGTRLLCTLLFGRAGLVGLLIAGWIACYWYYFPGDALRATSGTMAGAIGPYIVYLLAQERFGLQASLINLTPRRLLLCALGCAIASPLLHHVWFALQGESHLLSSFLVMFIGDLAGTLIVVYIAKGILALLPAADGRLRR